MKEMLYAVRCLKDFKLNCARIISSFDFKHRTAYNISFNRYIVATFSTFFLIPVCLLIIIYGTITVSLKRGQLERMKISKPKRSRDHKRNRRIIGVSVAILASFAISIGPLFVLNFIKIFHGQVPPEAKTYPAIEFIIGSLLVHSWGAINPIMCFAFSENYRAGLKHIVCGRSRAGSISFSATKKLTLATKRTRNENDQKRKRLRVLQTNYSTELSPHFL